MSRPRTEESNVGVRLATSVKASHSHLRQWGGETCYADCGLVYGQERRVGH